GVGWGGAGGGVGGRLVADRRVQGEGVAVIVLRAVGVARPEDEGERAVARAKGGQDRPGDGVREVLLLDVVGTVVAGGRGRVVGDGDALGDVVARGLIAQAGGARRQPGVGERGDDRGGWRDAGRGAGEGIDDDRGGRHEGAVDGVGLADVLDGGWAELADRGGGVAVLPGEREQALLVEEVAAEVVVDVAEGLVVLNERRRSAGRLAGEAAGVEERVAGEDGVAEVAGVAGVVAGGDGGSVRRRERP